MKVKEILFEGVIPPHIKMTLQSIVANGGCTNHVHIVILANTVELLKNYPENDIWMRKLNSYHSATANTIDLFTEMTGNEQVHLASWCLDVLDEIVSRDEIDCDPNCELRDFTEKVLKSQR